MDQVTVLSCCRSLNLHFGPKQTQTWEALRQAQLTARAGRYRGWSGSSPPYSRPHAPGPAPRAPGAACGGQAGPDSHLHGRLHPGPQHCLMEPAAAQTGVGDGSACGAAPPSPISKAFVPDPQTDHTVGLENGSSGRSCHFPPYPLLPFPQELLINRLSHSPSHAHLLSS